MVTGAERGIGREIVRQLVACEAEVIALSLNLSELGVCILKINVVYFKN